MEMSYEEMKQIVKDNLCACCGGELQIHTNESGNLEIWCPHNPDHHGYIERETYTQAYRRGEDIHPIIKSHIEKKMLPGGYSLGVALALIKTRFPRAELDDPSAALFVMDCIRLDLDPLLGEIVPVTFKTTDKETKEVRRIVQPILTEDGWLSLAARACPEAWLGPPKTMRLEEYLQTQDAYKGKPYTEIKEVAKEIKVDLCKDSEAYVWLAIGHRKDQKEDTVGYGWYKASEEGIVAKNLPGNQARVRAIKRWVRETFPEAKAKMKEMTSEWLTRGKDIEGVQQIIEAEYHIVTELAPFKGGEKIGGTAEEKEGGEEKPGATILSPTKQETKTPPVRARPQRDPNTIKTIQELYKACHEDWGLQPNDVLRELGVSSQADLSDTPANCYRQIAAVR